MKEYAEIFRVLGDETRLRILHLLLTTEKELCVCELTDSLEVSEYNVSRHLKILKYAGLVNDRKEGRWVYFSVPKDKNPFKETLLKSISYIPQSLLAKDQMELKKRLKIRVKGVCILGVQKKQLFKRNTSEKWKN